MRVMQTYDSRPDCDFVCFGEAVTRDPFLLIGREPRPDFTPADLFGERVTTVSEVPTPWLCVQEDLRRAGLDPDCLSWVADQTMAENAAALRRGELDVVQLFQPFAEELIAAGEGYLWYAAATRGPTSYTTFYTRRSVLAARRDELKKVVRGLYRTQKWLHASPPEALADVVQSFFRPSRGHCCAPRSPATERSTFGAAIRSCRAPATTGCGRGHLRPLRQQCRQVRAGGRQQPRRGGGSRGPATVGPSARIKVNHVRVSRPGAASPYMISTKPNIVLCECRMRHLLDG